jgi:uncharacterized protein YutE (UPF0331/DUF86 family)
VSRLDREILAERTAVVERHLARVQQKLPVDPEELRPASDSSDAVILHLLQAVQVVIDLAMSACIHFHLGTPASYGDAFLRLAEGGHLERELALRLVRAAGFRNAVTHNYDSLDMLRVHRSASEGPTDLRAFLAALAATIV